MREKNAGPFGRSIMDFAERWGRLMQIQILSGKKVEEVAESTADDADIDGISGAMFGFAVVLLADCWAYGEELRTWHNLAVQLGDEGERANAEGGVLNPAILHIK